MLQKNKNSKRHEHPKDKNTKKLHGDVCDAKWERYVVLSQKPNVLVGKNK
jgi:hypothetical protein